MPKPPENVPIPINKGWETRARKLNPPNQASLLLGEEPQIYQEPALPSRKGRLFQTLGLDDSRVIPTEVLKERRKLKAIARQIRENFPNPDLPPDNAS